MKHLPHPYRTRPPSVPSAARGDGAGPARTTTTAPSPVSPGSLLPPNTRAWLAVALLAHLACASASAVPFGTATTLQQGESASFDGGDLTVTFDGIARDNRCPRNVQCIVAGAATVELTAHTAGGDDGLTLDVPPGGSATTEHAGYSITVESVTPEPIAGERIDPKDYAVTLVVERG